MSKEKNTTETRAIEFDNNKALPILFGPHNTHLDRLEDRLAVQIQTMGNQLSITGAPADVNAVIEILNKLYKKAIKEGDVDMADIDRLIRMNEDESLTFTSDVDLSLHTRKRHIMPRTKTQAEYIATMNNKEMVFGLGPAGTGKTYLAVAKAVNLMLEGKIDKIILTRPAVEAGENLGFLPGDLKEKVDPYLRPLYDALYDMLGIEQVSQLIEKQIIEIAPLAYMRGRTLEKSFIILDEAQNATVDQLKMFLTRLGFNSKMIITGDISQIDLPNSKKSGLKISADLLKDLNEVGVIAFEKHDVVRHPLVAKIIEKFEKM